MDKKQWNLFKQFYETKPVILDTDKLPEPVKQWSETSWKKYFYLYIVRKKLYFVYPYVSYSTNFGNMGTHYRKTTSILKVVLMTDHKNNLFPKLQEAKIIYDAYMELLPESFWDLGVKKNIDFCVDMYGSKQLELFKNENWLSIKECIRPIEQYGMDLIPMENNIICGFTGNIFSFSKRVNYKENIKHGIYDKICRMYNETIYNRGYRNGYGLLRLLRLFRAIRRKLKN